MTYTVDMGLKCPGPLIRGIFSINTVSPSYPRFIPTDSTNYESKKKFFTVLTTFFQPWIEITG